MPTVALQPGSTNASAVKQLQDYLVSKGYLTQAQVNTGYGTYGPQTTAAVLKLQKDLGIDYSSGPGYFGPKTISALQTGAVQPNSPTSSPGGLSISVNPNVPGGISGSTTSSAPGQSSQAPAQTNSFGDTFIGTWNGTPIYQMANGNQTNANHTTYYSINPDPSITAGFVPAKAGATDAGSATGGGAGNPNTELASILADKNLSADQKTAIQAIYDATASGDATRAQQVIDAMKAAGTYSDPYFKAQIRLATDALDRGISGKEGDLAFAEAQQKSALKDLQDNTAASKDYLSFTHAQELKNLESKYQQDLSSTQDNLAAAGLTSSSKRARAEQILSDNNTGLVEGSNKQFSYQTGNLDRTLASSETNTAAQIDNLRRLASEGKLDLYRSAEQQVGSSNLPAIGGMTALGDVGGTIPRAQALDQFQFASNFVF